MRSRVFAVAICAVAFMLASCGKKEEAAPVAAGSTGPVQAQASDLHPCKVTGTRLTVEDCEAAQYWLDQAKSGTAAFSAPTRMLQGQTKLVTLAIGTAPPPVSEKPATPVVEKVEVPSARASQPASAPTSEQPSQPASGIPAEPASPAPAPDSTIATPTPHQVAAQAAGTTNAQTVDYYPFVGRQMAADLEGTGFDIKPMSHRVQSVADGAVTTWEWQVTAREYGKKTLVLKTTVVMLDAQGNAVPLKPTTEFKEVSVWIWFDGIFNILNSWPDWLKVITAILGGLAALIGAWKGLKKVLGGRQD